MASSWTCTRCEVTTTLGDTELEHPVGWAKENGKWLCLGCRRLEVEESVQADGTEGKGGQAAARRRALTEFEIRRDPEAPDQVIAQRARCSTSTVAPVREAMRAELEAS
jgi:hypothetical protein